MEELPVLYESVYDPPFVLPSRVSQELRVESEEARTGLKREVSRDQYKNIVRLSGPL